MTQLQLAYLRPVNGTLVAKPLLGYLGLVPSGKEQCSESCRDRLAPILRHRRIVSSLQPTVYRINRGDYLLNPVYPDQPLDFCKQNGGA